MKRFSQDVDREFEIGGQVFKWKQPAWEEFSEQIDKDMADAQAAVNGSEETAEEQDLTVKTAVGDLIKKIELFLDPEDDAIRRWKALCKRKDNAVPIYQFRELHDWLYGVASGRPPTEEPSSDGQPPTDTTSTEDSN